MHCIVSLVTHACILSYKCILFCVIDILHMYNKLLIECRHLSVMLSNVLALRPTNWGRNVADTPVVAVSVALRLI